MTGSFGYADGISQPAVIDVDKDLLRGQDVIDQGIILLGRPGDTQIASRPSWALDGSFLAFRYLSQLVPEFQRFVDSNNPVGATQDFVGARLVGRWKSGAPIDLSPTADDEALGTDDQRNNKFRYDPFSQDRCPFAAHTRKTNPRSDLPDVEKQRIIRRGIAFGPEVQEEEKGKTTIHDRGLLFKAYQSNINLGFAFIQKCKFSTP
jgi:Dyp-type peroxidase family